MAYTGHVITQERKYGDSIFRDVEIFDRYFSSLIDRYDDLDLFTNEERNYFEIPRDIVAREIVRLAHEEAEFEFQDYLTTRDPAKNPPLMNQDVANSLSEALDQSPKDSYYVALEWF